MRIDAYSAIGQTYAPTRSQGIKQTGAVSAYAKDELQISSIGKEFQIAKQAVSGAADVREDVVASMKQKYSGNNYDVDPGSFADVLLSKFNQTI